MHRPTGGTRRWSWLTAAVSAGAHSCGSAPVSHRLPPPGARDRSGHPTAPVPSRIQCARRRGWARPRSSGHPRGMHRRAATPRPWHSLAWLGWAIAAAACVQLAPSPVYVALVIGICWLVVEAHAADGPYRRAFPALVALGVVFGMFRVTIAALTTHNGIDVLVTIAN